MGKKQISGIVGAKPLLIASGDNKEVSEKPALIIKSADNLTMLEIYEFVDLLQNFIVESDLVNTIKNSNFFTGENGHHFDFFAEIPKAIFKSKESREAYNKLVEFVINSSLSDVAGKKIFELYTETLEFIRETDAIGFFSRATTVFTKLIKG